MHALCVTSLIRRSPLVSSSLSPTKTRSVLRLGQAQLQHTGVHARCLHRNAPNPMPATYMRGGTSKGIFLNRVHLPADRKYWKPIFLGLMGSPDREYGRQLNGMGGGISSLSKICVVEAPSAEQKADGIDVVYTFVQVGVRDDAVDYSGNCGNLSSMIGVYAMDEGLCRPRAVDAQLGTVTIRSFNMNTHKVIDTTFPVAYVGHGATPLLDLPQVSMAGVPGKASQIVMDFVSPGGARTGKLLPTGRPVDEIPLSEIQPQQPAFTDASERLRVSLVDATNPTVFVDARGLAAAFGVNGDPSELQYDSSDVQRGVEAIRQRAAQMMGLDPTAQAQPKIAMLSPPGEGGLDIVVHAFSMGVLHKAVPMTVGMCLGVASIVKGTIAWDIVQEARSLRKSPGIPDATFIQHPGGITEVRARLNEKEDAESASVIRTGRRLMKGVVWW